MFSIAVIDDYSDGRKIGCWARFAMTVYGRGVRGQSQASFSEASLSSQSIYLQY